MSEKVKTLDFVFNGTGPDRYFVEVEIGGKSVRVGAWEDRPDGFCHLRIGATELAVLSARLKPGKRSAKLLEEIDTLTQELATLREWANEAKSLLERGRKLSKEFLVEMANRTKETMALRQILRTVITTVPSASKPVLAGLNELYGPLKDDKKDPEG